LPSHPYFKKEVVLTSKHRKIDLIKPAFDISVGCNLFELPLDTDQLGTFTGDIARLDPPLETAIKKARLGMSHTGTPLGIASEGSICPDPIVPFLHSDIEYLVFVDDENEIVISETFRSFDITLFTTTVSPKSDLNQFLQKADFPNHKLIVRPNRSDKSGSIKGIDDQQYLSEVIEKIAETSPDGLVVVESDLRAISSPSRQKNIEQVANLLALRISQLCPDCKLPGWGCVGYEKGLTCSECGSDNQLAIRQEILGCAKCEFTKSGKVIASELSPANCDICNP
jgi:hypothetical protein